jgi:hypothetical protein
VRAALAQATAEIAMLREQVFAASGTHGMPISGPSKEAGGALRPTYPALDDMNASLRICSAPC